MSVFLSNFQVITYLFLFLTYFFPLLNSLFISFLKVFISLIEVKNIRCKEQPDVQHQM